MGKVEFILKTRWTTRRSWTKTSYSCGIGRERNSPSTSQSSCTWDGETVEGGDEAVECVLVTHYSDSRRESNLAMIFQIYFM